jgi:hypothetical protein
MSSLEHSVYGRESSEAGENSSARRHIRQRTQVAAPDKVFRIVMHTKDECLTPAG